MTEITLAVTSLSKAGFAPFGDVIETDGRTHYPINDGTCERYHDLANIDVLQGAGRPLISIFRAQPVALPIRIEMMERHPLSSQAFVPLSAQRFLIVVAPVGETVDANALAAFVTNGTQGVNYHRGVWHHPLLALGEQPDFLVVDRGGAGKNCDEFYFDTKLTVVIEALNPQ